MTIDIEDHEGVKLLRLSGELIGGAENMLVDTVTDLLSSRQARIVLDLGEVHYMNSVGLSDLVRLAAQANIQEARLVLAGLSGYLAGVLEMTKLDRFFEISASPDEALKMLTAQAGAQS